MPTPTMTMPMTSLQPLKPQVQNPITGPLPVNRDCGATVMPTCQPILSNQSDTRAASEKTLHHGNALLSAPKIAEINAKQAVASRHGLT